MDNATFHNGQHLSFEELIEYSKGNLSNAEMHRLELHLISCELCNDALDGIDLIEDNQLKAAVTTIEEANQINEESQFGIYHYIGIAASVIIIAVLGFIFSRSGPQEQLASTENQVQPAEPKALPKADSVDYAALDSTASEQDSSLLAMETPINDVEKETTVPIVNQEPEVLAAERVAASSSTETIADMEVPANLPDSNLIAGSAINLDTVPNTVVLAEEQTSAMAKKASAPQETSPSIADESEDSALVDELVKAEPPKGTRAFNRYLKRNLNYPENAMENNIEGDVELSVQVNSDGSIGNILVAKSLGYGCDEEAIRLVREGGNWIPASRGDRPVTDTVSVTVTFK
jgi:TonB family protein